jgi:hypothetical protein
MMELALVPIFIGKDKDSIARHDIINPTSIVDSLVTRMSAHPMSFGSHPLAIVRITTVKDYIFESDWMLGL